MIIILLKLQLEVYWFLVFYFLFSIFYFLILYFNKNSRFVSLSLLLNQKSKSLFLIKTVSSAKYIYLDIIQLYLFKL